MKSLKTQETMTKLLLKLLFVAVFFTSCIPMQKVPKDAVMSDFFHFQKAKDYDASKWAVFLPGTGGLRIFKDTTHYYDMARALNNEGISVLLVDNVAAYKASKRKVTKDEEEMILWTLRQALDWAKQHNYIDSNSNGSLVGWSRAGIGAIPLANDPERLQTFQINKMALFYPANPFEIDLKPKIPVLVITGGKDRIIKLDDILNHMVAENVTIKVYNDAYHGFDVESLEKGKYYRIIPFITKKIYLLKYDEVAAKDAVEEWIDFMNNTN